MVSTKSKFKITQDANIADVVSTYIRMVAPGRAGFPLAVRQAAENALDAKAADIHVTVDKESRKIYFIDQGSGMRRQDREDFHRLHLSSKDGVSTIGKNNTGRLSYLALCDNIRVITSSDEFGKMETYEFTFNRQTVESIIRSSETKETLEILPLKKKHPLETSLKGGTGTIVVLENVDFSKIPTISTLRQNLPLYFSRENARRIILNGKALPEIQQEGEPLIFNHQCSDLQNIAVDLFITKEKSKKHEVRIGANNPILTLKELLHSFFAEEQLRKIPDKLLHDQLGGTILCTGLNKFREHSSQGTLHENFIGSAEHLALLQFFTHVLGPQLDKVFKHLKEAEQALENDELKAELTDRLNPIFGYSPSKHLAPAGKKSLETKDASTKKAQKPITGLKVNHAEIELCPGEKHIFEVTLKSGTSGTFDWDATMSGGTIQRGKKTTSSSVLYTAGSEEGKFTLIVRDKVHSDLMTKITIHIVVAKTVQISPKRVKIQQGKQQRFRLVHPPSHDVLWKVTGPGKGPTLKPQTGTATVVHVPKNAAVGEYTLTASIGKQEYTETFIVEEPPKNDGYLLIDETLYLLQTPLDSEHLPYMASVDPNASLVRGSKVPIMNVNAKHAILEKQKPTQRLLSLIPALLHAHAQHMVNTGEWSQIEEVPFKTEELRLKVTKSLLS